MSKRKTLINRVVDRAVEDAETKKEIEDLRRKRREIIEDIENTLRPYRKDEADAIPDDDDDDDYIERERNVAEDIAYILPFYGDDDDDDDVRLDWDYEETEEWDE